MIFFTMEVIREEKQLKDKDFQGRSLKSLKQGLGRLLGRRSVTITEYDPTYKVVYLGNVLTGWAKGDSCTEKPLNTLWKNYMTHSKPDVQMKLIVTQSGLKALTKEHGLTEYWSHRVTYCCAPAELSKIFCWVYRHEGRKLKQELRCHAVLCAKESIARQIASQLQLRLKQALFEFIRDKVSRQNARLSLANAVYDNPSLPRRKLLLSTGGHNYKPPLDRSKSAPKLMSIEESVEEEDEHAEYGGKKVSRRLLEAKSRFATCRNLSYSNRGSRMGGLHGIRCGTPPTDTFHDLDTPQNSSHDEEMVAKGCTDVVEKNAFAFNKDCDLLGVLEEKLQLNDGTSKVGMVTNINEHLFRRRTKFFYKTSSWTCGVNEYMSPLPFSDPSIINGEELVIWGTDEHDKKCNRLVRSQRMMFESGDQVEFRNYLIWEGSPFKNLVKNGKKIFEGSERTEMDTDSALQFDLSEENRESLEFVRSVDDESTPSLQSISSGSDTSCGREIKSEYGKNCDLDSLWEEDSDESGFVDAIGQEVTDDKIRDLPHYQLMKNCLLTSKASRYLEV